MINPKTATITAAFEEAFHASIVALAKENTARKMLRDAGWNGKGKIWEVRGNKNLTDAHEKLAKEYIEFREKKGATPKTAKERIFKMLTDLWNRLAASLYRMGFHTQAGYFELLELVNLKKWLRREQKGQRKQNSLLVKER